MKVPDEAAAQMDKATEDYKVKRRSAIREDQIFRARMKISLPIL